MTRGRPALLPPLLVAIACTACAACNAPAQPPPGSAEDLAVYLRSFAGTDEATRAREVASWLVPEPTWNRSIVPAWRALYAEYIAQFAAASRDAIAQLASFEPITARRHWAGDRRLTRGEARLRWALPVQFPSMVAEIGGRPLDAVFIYDGRWRALLGVDELVLAHVRALDAACADSLARAGGPLGKCNEVGFVVAQSALRADRPALDRACHMATAMCGTPAP